MASSRPKKLPFDPIDEAARQWAQRWDGVPAMHAVTSLMRVQQLVLGRLDAILRPHGLTFARYEALVLLCFSSRGSLPLGKMGERLQVHPTSITSIVQRLEADGLVSRRPRRGTRVERLKPHSVFVRSLHSLDELTEYSVETDRQVLSIAEVVVDEADARVLGCRPGERWTKIRMLRIDPADDGWPLCCTDVYLEPGIAEAVGDQVLDPKRLISDMVEQVTGRTVHTIEQRMRAATVPDSMVDLLHTTAGSPVLRMTRRYLDRAGDPFEITVSVHPAERFEYAVDLERGRG